MSSKSAPKKKVPTEEEPAKKKSKTGRTQSNISSFFSTKQTAQPPEAKNPTNEQKPQQQKPEEETVASKEAATPTNISTLPSPKKDKDSKNKSNDQDIPDPIVPVLVTPRNAVWQSLHDNFVILRKATNDAEPRSRVAAFDLDGTLMRWSSSFNGFWPSQLTHYELWSSTVPETLRRLYDDGYKLLLISNQGGIQKAHTGKKATLVKNVIDFLAAQVDRPIHAVLSTKSLKKEPKQSFHKPTPKMWQVAVEYVNHKEPWDVTQSFFVGDSDDPNDDQGGVDLKFAQAVSEQLKFYTPTEYLGPSDAERRQTQTALMAGQAAPPPDVALKARSALLGGYLPKPILLILCGVQGSGKSTFCRELLGEEEEESSNEWVHLSQDTIRNGKPGKREHVEEGARDALRRGRSVVVDRMHLDPEQRAFFVQVAQAANVPAHALVLNPPRFVIAQRVRERTNHPGKVEGEEGAKRALASLDKLILPTYTEELTLISVASTDFSVSRFAQLYRGTLSSVHRQIPLSDSISIPTIALGTMGLGRKMTKEVVQSVVASAGFRAIDTAPTYKNEDRVGDALADLEKQPDEGRVFCIAKIPKAVTEPDQVGAALEATIEKLRRDQVDLLLLHWPCDVIAGGTLATVWKAMEECVKDGKCQALGVCNFNANALRQLLVNCSIPPLVNQVERHPLLSQMELVDFCAQHNILLQAHTPLGQGKDELLAHPVVVTIAQERSLNPAQVVLQWNLQQGCLVVPKCSTLEHARDLTANLEFLSPEHMKALDGIDRGKRFVDPPFMYGDQPFCWGSRAPPRKKTNT